MLPSARLLLPAAAAAAPVLYRFYKYLRAEVIRVPQNPPELSDLDLAILEEIRKLGPALLDKILKDPALLDEFRKIDPAVLHEFRKLDPAIIGKILQSCLKDNKEGEEEADRSTCSGRETAKQNENGNEETEGGGGGENKNENGGEVEKKVVDEERSRSQHYPVRPGAGEGKTARKNRKNNQVSKDKMKEREGLAAEKPGQTECKDYSRSGGRKYEKACSLNPGRGEPSVAPILECNFLGLPIRPGEKDCSFYMRNASCMFGTNCRFNHPDPTAARESEPPSGYGNGGSAALQGASSSTAAPWSAPSSLNDVPLYVPMVSPHVQIGSWGNADGVWAQSEVGNKDEASGWTKPAFINENQNDSWNKPSGVDDNKRASWGKADGGSTWTKQDGDPTWNKQGEGSTWNKQDGSSAWNKPAGDSSWSKQAGWSSWGKQADVTAGHESGGVGNQDNGWKRASSFGGSQSIDGVNGDQPEDFNNNRSGGNWRGSSGRGNSDRGGFRGGRGFVGRGGDREEDRGGFGRRWDFGGKGGDRGSFGGRGRSDKGGFGGRGYGGRGRGRYQSGGWSNRNESIDNNSSGWSKGADGAGEGWRRDKGGGSWNHGSKNDWQGRNSSGWSSQSSGWNQSDATKGIGFGVRLESDS
ncbi:PREDICTED: zinc finger [Prunus dulcis]|uniref:PREDICTED: zinc finger n=1 Tax=Prunus dulcis TaxID=3755 RepID=A0A5E4FJK2_PRUDU|nr:PREDICTED: zinc finger [Prunus dulcis]